MKKEKKERYKREQRSNSSYRNNTVIDFGIEGFFRDGFQFR